MPDPGDELWDPVEPTVEAAPPAPVVRGDPTELDAEPKWPVSEPPPPKKSRTALAIGCAVGLLLVGGAAAAVYLLAPDLIGLPVGELAEAGVEEGGASESGEAASGEAASGEAESGEAASGEAESGEAASGEAASGEAASGEAESGEAASGEAESGEAESGEAASGEAASGEAEAEGEEVEGEGAEIEAESAFAGRSADSLVREAEALVRQDQLARAAPLFERAFELDPDDNHVLIGMARVYISRGDGARAVELAEAGVRMRPRRVEYRIVLGDAHRLAGNVEEARAAWTRARQLEPSNRAARERLASLGEGD
jgi:tetratricopeptide (TPR) repeat protein